MNWFEEQLHYRKQTDDANFADAINSIADAVMGTRLRESLSQNEIAGTAVDEIIKYYFGKVKSVEIPEQIQSVDEQIEYRIRPYGLSTRRVKLGKAWYKCSVGAMLGTLKEDGSAVALIPGILSGYWLVNIKTGEWIKVSKKNEDLIDDEAVLFYISLPQRSLKIKDLLLFMSAMFSSSDIILCLGMMCITTALGLISPMITKWLFGDVLASGDMNALIALAVFAVCYSISKLCFSLFQALINARLETKQSVAVQSAVMNRILNLPPAFFKDYSAGELAQRVADVQSLCSLLIQSVGMVGLTSLFSLVYIGQIFTYAPALVVPSLTITAVTILFLLITTFSQMRRRKERMELSAKTSGLTYAMISGIQKIKLAGAEKRMFARWARQYSKEAGLEYNPPILIKLSNTIGLAISLTGMLIIYSLAIKNNIEVADYYAFNSAYAMVSNAFMSVVAIAATIADIRPTLEMAKPILEAAPEVHEDKETVVKLRGDIEISHLSFRYDESMENVIDDLSLKIKPGEYLAIVGPTGCGKSTLLRLLLGFETPKKGSIFYDKKDLTRIDLQSLRKKIGVVMQDARLFLGDIYTNIVITAPQLSMDAAWEAAEIASIADDIRSMPMGMNTVISEGQGGISGGQKQRIMIARAVAPKPSVLMFDEATSALDNITQKKVSEAIDSLKCTRIVIAHRLSTIQHADRIIYLDNGKILEDGTYEELIAKGGYFAKLVERQQLHYGE